VDDFVSVSQRDWIKKHKVYTISSTYFNEDDTLCVCLCEVPRAIISSGDCSGFRASRFRPGVKTDISIFTAMLNPAPTRVDA